MDALKKSDGRIYDYVRKEIEREEYSLILIASENYVDQDVLEAQGTLLTNKYAEGYPNRRFYGGCRYVDAIERIAIERACRLFGAEYANVQPHSGSSANMAVIFAVLRPGDKILGMDLTHGGHLTHGAPSSFSGRFFTPLFYQVSRKDERIDYDQVREISRRERPKLIIAGASAYSRIIDFGKFREIADETGAYLLVDMAHIAGAVATGLHPSPVGAAHFVTGTTHKTLRGPRGGLILADKKHGKLIDSMVFPGIQGGPLMHVIAAKAVALKNAMTPEFRAYQEQIIKNSRYLASSLEKRGYRIVSGGTDNHLFLVDLTGKGITGIEAQESLEKSGIVLNRNVIPFDTKGPSVTSGIRIGTPAITTRGMKEPEMEFVAEIIDAVLLAPHDEQLQDRVREGVKELCRRFPFYSRIYSR
ncbi:MAG: serine hydroxymethyltransferase [Syntrophorhabdales bacterium]|jgi:glycine hydroxymethyltransferase